ncbi:hypothetical protein ACJX0J_016615, partial [Zea mays]
SAIDTSTHGWSPRSEQYRFLKDMSLLHSTGKKFLELIYFVFSIESMYIILSSNFILIIVILFIVYIIILCVGFLSKDTSAYYRNEKDRKMLDPDLPLHNALLDMYCCSGDLDTT